MIHLYYAHGYYLLVWGNTVHLLGNGEKHPKRRLFMGVDARLRKLKGEWMAAKEAGNNKLAGELARKIAQIEWANHTSGTPDDAQAGRQSGYSRSGWKWGTRRTKG